MLYAALSDAVGNPSGEASMEQFSQTIKLTRQKMNWSQEHLARKIGVSLSTIQRWERQGGKPNLIVRKVLTRLFNKLGIANPFNIRA